jgi:hypothetical protein
MESEEVSLVESIEFLYATAVTGALATSTLRLRRLGDYCVQQLARRGLPGAEKEVALPGGARPKQWDVAWKHVIPEEEHRAWFRQIWELPGASTQQHPAPFPLELAERLVRMFSFVGDTILDPFMGTGTTNLAASLCGRNSIGCEIDPAYFEQARQRLEGRHGGFFAASTVEVHA